MNAFLKKRSEIQTQIISCEENFIGTWTFYINGFRIDRLQGASGKHCEF